MPINHELLAAARTAFRAVLGTDDLPKEKRPWERLALLTKSTGASEEYAFGEDLGGMEEWIDDRTATQLRVQKFTILNKDFQKAIRVHKNDIADDRLGMYASKLKNMKRAQAAHYWKLIIDLLLGGFAAGAKAYDGKAFFATTHAFGSNKGTGVLSATNFDTAMQKLYEMAEDAPDGEDAEPLDVVSDSQPILVCGPSNRATARKLLKIANLGSDGDNPNFEEADLIVTGRITGAKWFVLLDGLPIKPLLLQLRSETQPDWVTEPGKEKPTGMFGFDARYNAGYALPQLAYGSSAGE